MGKGGVISKEKRGSRSKKLQMLIPLPAIVRRINEKKPRDKRMGSRAMVHVAAQVEYLCRLLMEDTCLRVKDGSSKTVNVKHLAQSLNDHTTPFYGVFNNRVACVYTTKDTDANEDENAQESAVIVDEE